MHPNPDAVLAPLFTGGSGFFLASDKVQVKYEMLRARLVDGVSVSEAAAAHGYSRAAFYLVVAAFDQSGMAGLIEEGKKTMEEDAEPSVMDAALIAAAQKVEHYEIASYGCVCTYAEMLGYDQVHDLLGQNLEEEETTDEKLSNLAESVINVEAEEAEETEEEGSR